MPLSPDLDATALNYQLMRTHIKNLDRLYPLPKPATSVLIPRHATLPKRNGYDEVLYMVASRRLARRRHNAGIACSIAICGVWLVYVFNLIMGDMGWILR